MDKIFGNDFLTVRKLQDCEDDYNLFLKWLSDMDVCEYYEGRTKPFNYEMVLEKFEERAKGIDPVIVGIIEHGGKALGWVQFYITEPGEYHESDVIDVTNYRNSYGIDIVIGDKTYWNQGIGTQIMQLTADYLFDKETADIIFIAPQTWNKRAIRCYEKSGFQQLKIIENMELHDDEYKDGLLMAKTKNNVTFNQV
jgi:aminoglycoside 6'-N-acetyltransferase